MSAELATSDTPEVVVAPCSHKDEIGCALTHVPSCCACTDQRPVASAYPIYIDGEGMKMRGRRWQLYCWKCRDYWNLQNGDENTTTSLVTEELGDHTDQEIPSEVSGMYPQATHTQHQTNLTLQTQTWAFPPRENPALAPHMSPAQSVAGQDTPHNPFAQPLGQAVPTQEHSQTIPNSVGHVSGQRESAQHAPPRDTTPRLHQRREPQQNPFGTREDVESEDYQSPVAGLFSRAWTRYRDAEVARHSTQDGNIQENQFPPLNRLYNAPLNDLIHQFENFPPSTSVNHYITPQLPDLLATHRGGGNRQDMALAEVGQVIDELRAQYDLPAMGAPQNPIDRQDRPKGLSDEEMMVDMTCKVCAEQKADTLYEPCMHIALCHWCSDIVRSQHREGRKRWECPICRKTVKMARRVYLA